MYRLRASIIWLNEWGTPSKLYVWCLSHPCHTNPIALYYLPCTRDEKEVKEMIKHLFWRAVHSCIPTWYLFGWRRKHLYSLSRQVSSVRTLAIWTCPIYWLNLVATPQWIVKPWVTGPVTYKSSWGCAWLWIPVTGFSDSQNNHESGFAFRARVSQLTILLSKLYSISHLDWRVKIHSWHVFKHHSFFSVPLFIYVDQNYSM